TLCLWDFASGKQLWRKAREGPRRRFHDLPRRPLAFSADGKTLFTSETDRTVRAYDVRTGQELRRFEATEEDPVCSPDGRYLAVPAERLGLLRLDAKEPVLSALRPERSPTVAAFSADGRLLAAAHARISEVVVYETASAKECRRFRGHKGQGTIRGLTFSPDGRLLVSRSDDGTALVWDVTGRVPDGRLLPSELTPRQLQPPRD